MSTLSELSQRVQEHDVQIRAHALGLQHLLDLLRHQAAFSEPPVQSPKKPDGQR